jgi:hypothetical protein
MLVVNILVGIDLMAQITPTSHERILLPISQVTTPGAFGSLWSTSLYVSNPTEHDVEIYPAICAVAAPCNPSFTLPAGTALEAPIDRTLDGAPVGVLMWVPRTAAPFLHYGLRVVDQSRQLLSFGTSVPVVREEELRSSPIDLFPVPIGEVFRQSLRIYDPANIDGTRFVVEFFDMNSNERIAMEEFSTVRSPDPSLVPKRPAVIELHQFAVRYPTLVGSESVRVRVSPVASSTKYWAFISVTNNDLQHVTVLSPE